MSVYRDIPKEALVFVPGMSKDYYDSRDCVVRLDDNEQWQIVAGVSPSPDQKDFFVWMAFNPRYARVDFWSIIRDSRKYINYHKKSGRNLCCVVHRNRGTDVRFAKSLGFVESPYLLEKYQVPKRFVILCLR